MSRYVPVLLLCCCCFTVSRGEETIEHAAVTLIDDVRVPAPEAGVVAEVLITEGDLVKEKQIVVELDRRLIDIGQRSAAIRSDIAKSKGEDDSDVRFADETKTYTTRILEIYRRLEREVSNVELQRAQLEAAQANLSVEKANRDFDISKLEMSLTQEELKSIKVRQEDRTLRSPINGMVVEVFRSPGEWVDQGEAVARVIRLEKLRVKCLVNGARYDQSLKGHKVILTVNLPPKGVATKFHGHVTFVSPEIDPASGLIQVWADIENPDLKLPAGAIGSLTLLDERIEIEQPAAATE